MNHSEQIDQLATALAAAQAQMQPAPMDGTNPHFRSRYASLASIVETIRKPLAGNGLAVSQIVNRDGDDTILETVLLHTSGQWIGGAYPVKPTKDDPQGIGSALTYARRYALASILGVVADDDDDGNAGSRQPKAPAPAAGKPATMPAAQPSAAKSTTSTPSTAHAVPQRSGAEKPAERDPNGFDDLTGHPKSAYGEAAGNGNGHAKVEVETASRPKWKSPQEAQAWAMGLGAFDHDKHCQNAYDKLRREYMASTPQPTAAGMFDAWYSDVIRRLAEKHAEIDQLAAGSEQPQF